MLVEPERLDLAPVIDEVLPLVENDARFACGLRGADRDHHARLRDGFGRVPRARPRPRASDRAAGGALPVTRLWDAPVLDAARGDHRRRSLPPDRGRIHVGRAAKPRLRPTRARSRAGGRPRTRRLQRITVVPSAAGCARCELGLRRGPRHRHGVGSPEVQRRVPAVGHPAGVADVGRPCPFRRVGEGRRPLPRREPLLVGDAPAPGARDDRDPRRRHADPLDDATSIVVVIQALVAMLSERFDAGRPLPLHETHWITENAWRAHRYGVRGWLVDLDGGDRIQTASGSRDSSTSSSRTRPASTRPSS
jgi:hypothetical protein